MIYFDNKKEAYGYEIQNPVAEIDESVWGTYCNSKPGIDWDIINGKFIQLKTIDEVNRKTNAEERICELKSTLSETDYKVIKYVEGLIPSEEYLPIKAQREEWRKEIRNLEQYIE